MGCCLASRVPPQFRRSVEHGPVQAHDRTKVGDRSRCWAGASRHSDARENPLFRKRSPSRTKTASPEKRDTSPTVATRRQEDGPRFPRPKIFVVDDPNIADLLHDHGYAVTRGTFGSRLIVPMGDAYVAPKPTHDLPNYTEQEIIIANLAAPDPIPATPDSFNKPVGIRTAWAPAKRGVIDTRPIAMLEIKSAMNRIYQHGGIFVFFSDMLIDPEYLWAESDSSGQLDPYTSQQLKCSNWSMLSELEWLGIRSDSGQEMDNADNATARGLGIDGYFADGSFDCTLKPAHRLVSQWSTLAANKFGDPVAGVIVGEQEEGPRGLIFIFPQLSRRAELVVELVERVFPELAPRLFPHAEGSQWTRRVEYDLPKVSALKKEITALQEETRARIRQLEEEIEAERHQYDFLHEIITATGDDLVKAVIRALGVIGFQDVRDADAEVEAAGITGQRREDLRIMDAPVPVLVEVKGIAGMPKEANALQVAKYISPRMRDWGRTDIRGLAIVNHQRHLPALERELENVFQEDVVTTAEEQGLTLLTTWDLFRLVRGFIANDWRHEDIADLFVQSGRMRPIPAHYTPVGSIDGFWPKASAVGIRLQTASLSIGDRIAYELPVDFVEESVTSLRLDNKEVENAAVGSHVGVHTSLTQQQARKSVPVYRVEPCP